MQKKKKEKDFRTPLYLPLAQILPQIRFPVNPWFTMNRGVQADLYVRYWQSTEAVRFIYAIVIRHTNGLMPMADFANIVVRQREPLCAPVPDFGNRGRVNLPSAIIKANLAAFYESFQSRKYKCQSSS